jgi:hypothetical protein
MDYYRTITLVLLLCILICMAVAARSLAHISQFYLDVRH